MRSRLLLLITAIGLSLAPLPAQAQVNDRQINDRQTNALVEALRQAAPQTGRTDDGLYSEWQVMPGNIGRWSRSCIDRELTPDQFETSPATARSIVACVMRDVLQAESRNSSDEAIAVRRAAAWWMTGDSSRYNRPETREYTNRVLSLYQQQIGSTTAQPSATQQPTATPPRSQSTAFDRYMRAGYAATNARDYATALLYFRRAIDERPNNSYAQQAIQNVERYLQPQ